MTLASGCFPKNQAGNITLANLDFVERGGRLIITRFSSPLSTLEHFGHHVMVFAFDKFRPDGVHEGQEASARFVRIGSIRAQEKAQMTGDLSPLFGGQALVVEELCVILEPAAFTRSAHGAIIAK
jgi:hypothetical protein